MPLMIIIRHPAGRPPSDIIHRLPQTALPLTLKEEVSAPQAPIHTQTPLVRDQIAVAAVVGRNDAASPVASVPDSFALAVEGEAKGEGAAARDDLELVSGGEVGLVEKEKEEEEEG